MSTLAPHRFVRSGTVALACALLTLGLVAVPAGAQEYGGLDRSVLEDETRPESDVRTDEGRKVIDVYEWVGIEPGMTVADVFPGRGYNTHLLSRLMGEQGRVVCVLGFYKDLVLGQNPEPFDVSVMSRIEGAGLDNVEVVDMMSDVPDESLDVVMLVRNYHDVGHSSVAKEWSPAETVSEIYRSLKPGGVVGLIEVATDRPGWDEETHRLNRDVVVEDFTGGGFELVDESDMLANPDDDYATSGFQTGRHNADRYLLKFQKPEADEGM